ncbi:MAG: hypothetical protein QNJ26_08575 [Desulfobacterales bacterium]|nr:hypothetical protein [Desulfobacterales bacterium]
MQKMIFRCIANAAIVVGFFLLTKAIYGAADNTIASSFWPQSQGKMWHTLVGLSLSLPIPLHIISVGLILQRRWLPPQWAKIAMPAVVISGCWLGAALAIKLFLIR